VRTTARRLGATVTGTIGVVVRVVEDGLDQEEAYDLIQRIDSHGLHMTGRLRETDNYRQCEASETYVDVRASLRYDRSYSHLTHHIAAVWVEIVRYCRVLR
jgi:hypothetical protein